MPPDHENAFELWCYYGFGVVLNPAQLDLGRDVLYRWPAGTAHVERWANRAGKTTGVMLLHAYAIWLKWRYVNASFDDWFRYRYQTLHTAPENRLMGKAWQIAESLIAGSADQQKNPFTSRQRPGALRGFFNAGSGQAKDGSEILFVSCLNNAKIDFLSTHDGAGRMESDAWWLIGWDEFVRHKPVEKVPLLIDQTFLARSSDYMAPLIFTSTATEESEAVYGEIEEIAEENRKHGHKDWNFVTAGRAQNFSQSKESIERQRRMSIDKEAAGRSVDGLSGQSGYGLFPDFVLANAFTDQLPEHVRRADIEAVAATFRQRERNGPLDDGITYITAQAFDHATSGDESVVRTWALPWPPAQADLLKRPILGVHEAVLRSSRNLTPDELLRFMAGEAAAYQPKIILIDATAEGGQMLWKAARRMTYVVDGRIVPMPIVECNFARREENALVGNKDLALQRLQRLLSLGLELDIGDDGWINGKPEPKERFGGLRLPAAWRRTKRQYAIYKRYDAKLTQDRLIVDAMLAWYFWRAYDGRARNKPQKYNIMARRQRGPLAVGGMR